ncbi:Na+/H+ antiporter NhaC [Natranaerobius thermophilus]|uniref:Na+/H+ antiporter NhaC n=1 Tax=Natranaerobius thermophilus (strain ATCC BAA-1301 / DSM 18059 / JW/NM-WN-LF) TaxID=457570 RepID=B2A7D2_NATTJ|nr:Na+/H+ antiporter NhaC [Natranaerobius thermophilus]ACB84326.1 Na+/H+ antiporter NhaC [Natranaerobius thermophilus JW/NM-WN-LF]
MNESNQNFKKPSAGQAFTPLIALIVLVAYAAIFLGADVHIPLFIAVVITAIVAVAWIGHEWKVVQDGMIKGINFALDAVIILSIVGILVGSWVEGGIVPTIVYYGLQMISPQIFLIATLIICALVSIFTGSSWSSLATVGLAMFGIGEGLGIPGGMTVGAIVSGAYFGDKLSPLSDTTVVASGAAGVNIYDHIKHMLWVSGPGFVISLIVFGIFGLQYAGSDLDADRISEITGAISGSFNVSPIMFIPLIVVLVMILMRVPPIPALVGGCFLGLIWAMVFQGSSFADVLGSMNYGFVMESNVELVDDLFTTGGLQSMMWTISLILIALTFGGIIEHTKMMEVILEKILNIATTKRSLIIVSHITTLILILTVLSHYLTHVLTCRAYKHAFEERGLHAKNVSRISEAWGTLPSSLIPWGPCGAYVFGLFGVPVIEYFPFAIYILATMVVSMVFAIVGFSMEPYEKTEA